MVYSVEVFILGKIKGWKKLPASDYGLSTWMNKAGRRPILLSLRRPDSSFGNASLKVVERVDSDRSLILVDKKFKDNQKAYEYAINFMRRHPNG